ncbi:MAG: DUF3306 domain-containing protein [Rhodobacteraceae bacterium]|nr:DUF3306 domain-containing protein [Paracoccaceae bacterium]
MPRRPDDDARAEGDEGFLGRWSRRKRSEPEDTAAERPEPPAPTDAPADPDPAPITPEELEALPKIEDLMPGSDIRGFLRPGVPRTLKNAALRRMWMLTPAIRDHADPAVDYAWDWNTPGGVPGDGLAPAPERAAEMLRALRAQPDRAERAEPEPAPATPPQRGAKATPPVPPAAADAGPAGPEGARPVAESGPSAAGDGQAGGAAGAASPDDTGADTLTPEMAPAARRTPGPESAPVCRRHGGARPV